MLMLRVLFYITTISLCISLIYASDNIGGQTHNENRTQPTVGNNQRTVKLDRLEQQRCHAKQSANYLAVNTHKENDKTILALATGYALLQSTGNEDLLPNTPPCDLPHSSALNNPKPTPFYMELSFNNAGCCIYAGCDNTHKVCRKPKS